MNNYCRKCGKQLEVDTVYCPKCGTPINQQQNIQPQPVYTQPQVVNVENNKPDGLSTAGFIMGIISLFISFYGFIAFLALILSCVGLAQTPKTDTKGRSRATTGIVLGIIGILWGLYQLSQLYR